MPRTNRARSTQHALAAAALMPFLLPSDAATAQDRGDLQHLQGAWVPEGVNCEHVFFRQGTSIHFIRRGAITREGIVIKGDRVEDSRNRCTISRSKAEERGETLLLSCFSGLLVSKVAISLRFLDQDTLIRTLSDFPDDELRLRRCRI
jgi:hypothetical protein